MMEHKSTGFIKHIHLAKANRNGRKKKKDAELGRGPSSSSPHSPNKIFVAVRFVIGFRNWVSQLHSLSTVFFFGVSGHFEALHFTPTNCANVSIKDSWLVTQIHWNCKLAHRRLLHFDLHLNFLQRWVGRISEAISTQKKHTHNSRGPLFQNPGDCWEKCTASPGFSL